MNKGCLFQDVHKSMFDGFRWTDLHPHFDRTLILRQRYPRRDIRCIDHCLIKMNLFTQPALLYWWQINNLFVIGSINIFTVYTICYNQPCLITRHFGEDFFCGHVAVVKQVKLLYCTEHIAVVSICPRHVWGQVWSQLNTWRSWFFPLLLNPFSQLNITLCWLSSDFSHFRSAFPILLGNSPVAGCWSVSFCACHPWKSCGDLERPKSVALDIVDPFFWARIRKSAKIHEQLLPASWIFHTRSNMRFSVTVWLPRMKKSTMKPLRILVLIVFLLHLRREPGAWANHGHVFPGRAWLPWVYV